MTVTPMAAISAQSSTQSQAPTADRLELGQDTFMKLLLTQLKYQDPLSPMEDREFITQMAQFSTLSEMQKLNKSVTEMVAAQTLANATVLIGKTISGLSSSGDTVTGVAQAAIMREGKVYLRVGSSELEVATVREVTAGGTDGTAD